MKLTIFGATGALGHECLRQALDAGHDVTVLVRTPAKLAPEMAERATVEAGNALSSDDVARAIPEGTDGVLFAIGVDKHSPENLCTDATRHIFQAMRAVGARRFVWCGGGSNLLPEDVDTFGARFVGFFARTFMGLRHRDKMAQLELLAGDEARDIDWLGLRPLQMNPGPMKGDYRVGFHAFSGLSKIYFPDCAHAMLGMLEDDTWLRKAPIIQY